MRVVIALCKLIYLITGCLCLLVWRSLVSAMNSSFLLKNFTKNVNTPSINEFCLKLIKLDLKIVGDPCIFDYTKPTLVLANHINYLDILIIYRLIPSLFVAKAEISRWPLLGLIVKRQGTIFVDRNSMQKRISCIFEISRKLKHRSVCVFPEGTTSSSSKPAAKNWKPGNISAAKRAKAPILLCALSYEEQEKLAWIDDQGLIGHLIRTLSRKKTRAVVNVRYLHPEEVALFKNYSSRQHALMAVEKIRTMCEANHRLLQSVIELDHSAKTLTETSYSRDKLSVFT